MCVLICITLCPFLFCNHLEEEEKAGRFAIIMLQVYLLLNKFYGSFSRCFGLVCSVCLWYFLIIVTYFLGMWAVPSSQMMILCLPRPILQLSTCFYMVKHLKYFLEPKGQ